MKKIAFTILMSIILILSGTNIYGAENYSIIVNKTNNCVTVYDSQGVPIKAMICSVGKNPQDTPTGTFTTSQKYRWRYLFGNVYGQYATRICGHILFHSVCYKKQYEASLKTEEYNKLGTPASMGCIRLTAVDAKWIYDNCPIGTKVTVLNRDTDPLPKPKAIKLTEKATYPQWDPTDPHPNNPWKNEGVKFLVNPIEPSIDSKDALTGDEMGKVLREGVKAYDIANNEIHYDISCCVSTITPGKYPIKYFAYDDLGNYGEASTVLTVY